MRTLPRSHSVLAATPTPGTVRSQVTVRRWRVAWAGLAALGVANGALRIVVYEDMTGEQLGHQISSLSMMALIAGYAWLLQRRWPLGSARVALLVGAAWTAMTLAFEFGFGRYIAGTPWGELVADYDLLRGRLWVFVPLTMMYAPAAVARFPRGRGA
jgi:hypothetical protein